MKFKSVCIGILLCAFSSSVFAEAVPKIKVDMMLEYEGFLVWYAKKKGYDKELGIDIELNIDNRTGDEIILEEKKDINTWDIAATSIIPLILRSKDSNFNIIGVACDEAATTAVLVKKDSDMAKVQGWNEDFSDVYGSPESIKGKTFIVRGHTKSAYTLLKWIEIFDLRLDDVKIVNLPGDADMEKELQNPHIDGAALASPLTYYAKKHGYMPAARASEIDLKVPIVFIANGDFAKKNPNVVAKFLAGYLKAVNDVVKYPESMVKDYKTFIRTYHGYEPEDALCLKDMKLHEVFRYKDQRHLFERVDHRKSLMQKFSRKVTKNLMLMVKYIHPEEVTISHEAMKQKIMTDEYLILAGKYLDEKEL